MRESSYKVRVARHLGVGVALFMPLACGGKAVVNDAGGECTPGTVISCACFGSTSGAQVCGTDKTFANCTCPTLETAQPSAGGRREVGGGAGAGGFDTNTSDLGGTANSSAGRPVAEAGRPGASAGVGGALSSAGNGGAGASAGGGGLGGSADSLDANCVKVCAAGNGLMCKFMSECANSCVTTLQFTEYRADYLAMLSCWATRLNSAQYECGEPGDPLVTAPVPATLCESLTCKWSCEDATSVSVRVYERCGCP